MRSLLDQFVIIPSSGENLDEIMYFEPRIVKILSGMSITWMNRDTKTHRLTSGNADSLLPTEFFYTEDIILTIVNELFLSYLYLLTYLLFLLYLGLLNKTDYSNLYRHKCQLEKKY